MNHLGNYTYTINNDTIDYSRKKKIIGNVNRTYLTCLQLQSLITQHVNELV